jgi:hypothetical protein
MYDSTHQASWLFNTVPATLDIADEAALKDLELRV